jgi:hypothetical protein
MSPTPSLLLVLSWGSDPQRHRDSSSPRASGTLRRRATTVRRCRLLAQSSGPGRPAGPAKRSSRDVTAVSGGGGAVRRSDRGVSGGVSSIDRPCGRDVAGRDWPGRRPRALWSRRSSSHRVETSHERSAGNMRSGRTPFQWHRRASYRPARGLPRSAHTPNGSTASPATRRRR